jgi:hypothetical protein
VKIKKGDQDGDSAYIFDDPLLGTDSVAIFQLMLGKVDLRDRSFILDLINGPLDMSLGVGHDRGRMKWSKGKMAGRTKRQRSKLPVHASGGSAFYVSPCNCS